MKKVFIVGHNLGRLANQLWQYISVYAFCLEHHYQCVNVSFFEYESYFDKLPKSHIARLLGKINKIFLLLSKKYGRYVGYMVLFLYSKLEYIYYQKKAFCFSDWLYRNPTGINKYRNAIIKAFQPSDLIWNKINSEIATIYNTYSNIIGVHIRKGDYQSPAWKKLYFKDNEVYIILKKYLDEFNLNKKNTCFLICSDGTIDTSQFIDLSVIVSKGSPIEDLFKLSLTDIIIGSDSTFGAFASYYGNIPYIVFNKKMDWNYYKDKKTYFENKYNTTVHYRSAK
ncbi:hypothetical protein COY87_05840 [Candidatus Roizmanbacteria bacterium CG_4_10_14_0_8_um_filter_33_9]|uniref:Glycosyl transferase family 11 n=1 Tax=Candidatus Roizmanbacteria bacterium CG_4_10_14_0_8_um_filter_33_9 TaxID=1974826 RepID=A0A2M7QHQ2_9BACT|nr:MAG: hypothetical protein COY87_05840 [Candidatus Roizmanbacteria bacterium CG_4_10_14_0_8_um_filter_33_9]